MKKMCAALLGLLLFGAGGLFASDNRPIGDFDSGTGGLTVLEKKPKAHLEKPPVRTALFNGRDLAGWTAVIDHDVTGGYSAGEPTWFVTNGTIRTTGTPFGYLRTKREDFGDCKLHVEYRWWRDRASGRRRCGGIPQHLGRVNLIAKEDTKQNENRIHQ